VLGRRDYHDLTSTNYYKKNKVKGKHESSKEYEILNLWEKAKNNQIDGFKIHHDEIPKREVIMDTMGAPLPEV
jgi:hypothetical protein